MRYITFVAVLLVISALPAPDTYACSCVVPEVPQAFSEARAVFVGEVIEILSPRTDDPKAPLAARLYSIKFNVERSWKGVESQEIIILSDQGRAGCFSWGPFLRGERYLVYAERRTPAGVPIKSLAVLFSCNRTALLAKASEDLKELEEVCNASFQFYPKRLRFLRSRPRSAHNHALHPTPINLSSKDQNLRRG